jgi:hypothetical protein
MKPFQAKNIKLAITAAQSETIVHETKWRCETALCELKYLVAKAENKSWITFSYRVCCRFLGRGVVSK